MSLGGGARCTHGFETQKTTEKRKSSEKGMRCIQWKVRIMLFCWANCGMRCCGTIKRFTSAWLFHRWRASNRDATILSKTPRLLLTEHRCGGGGPLLMNALQHLPVTCNYTARQETSQAANGLRNVSLSLLEAQRCNAIPLSCVTRKLSCMTRKRFDHPQPMTFILRQFVNKVRTTVTFVFYRIVIHSHDTKSNMEHFT